MLLTILKFAISALILLFLILIIVKISKENYSEKPLPEGEAKYYYNKENQYGIPQCKYGGLTPILTCSYDSKV